VPAIAAMADSYSLYVDGFLTVEAQNSPFGLLHNDVGGKLSVVNINGSHTAVGQGLTLPSGGVLTFSSDGSFFYNPPAATTLIDSFTYTITDGRDFESANVTVTVLDPPEVTGIEYLPNGQGTTGDLSNDNPDGNAGTPNFMGGYRFFPDAETYATRNTARNIVRIRATGPANTDFHFRAFDVDDPSANVVIDPNGGDGKDNLGSVGGQDQNVPVAAEANAGYRGRLRPVGGNFAAEAAVITVQSNAQGIAEVELATSFNPGDNFRVVASVNAQRVQNLNDTTDVPTTGVVGNNFTGQATGQLSIWRRFHIESDSMLNIQFGMSQNGAIAGVVPNNIFNQALVLSSAVVTLNFQINVPDGYRGGNVRDVNGNQYPIISHSTANPSVVVVRVPAGLPAPALGNVKLTQGDFQFGNVTAASQLPGDAYVLATDLTITTGNEYAGGILRVGGVNYPILYNTSGQNAEVTIQSFAQPAVGAVEIYQDDFTADGNDGPVSRIYTPDIANFYDFQQVSTVRSNNRYADAYLQPEYNALAAFNSDNVTPVSHFPDLGDEYAAIADPYRGTSPGNAARPADYETALFWSVYVLAGYEEMYRFDYDGEDAQSQQEGGVLGGTDARVANQIEGEVSVVFTETIRDVATSAGATLTEVVARARTVVHEIGHQFGLSRGAPGNPHSDAPDFAANIMSSRTGEVPADLFYFLGADIVYLRKRIQSPGLPV